MAGQKLFRGQIVRIADIMPRHMAHFRAGCDAVIIGSYRDLCHGRDVKSFTVRFLDNGHVSAWYGEDQLTPLDREGGEQLIQTLMDMEDKRD
jgi:hypothetical protein